MQINTCFSREFSYKYFLLFIYLLNSIFPFNFLSAPFQESPPADAFES